jgi:tetratricopeptide (TPR) repeat protein
VRKAREPASLSPEQHLEKAVLARTAATRAKHAKLGLSVPVRIDKTTQAMLLRQLYLAHYEARKFKLAREIATQLIDLDVLSDVAHQDRARASQALGDVDDAVGQLRLAARKSPASRRAFHLWTLGGLLYLRGRFTEAAGVLSRAARWGTTDKPLYMGHAALARCAQGETIDQIDDLVEQLAAAPCGQGYGRFVLGRLCMYAGRRHEAAAYLDAFVRRTESGRVAVQIALSGELEEARRSLDGLQRN